MKVPDNASAFLNVFAALSSVASVAVVFWGIMPRLNEMSASQESMRKVQAEQAEDIKKLAQDNSKIIAKSKADLEGVAKTVKQIKEDNR